MKITSREAVIYRYSDIAVGSVFRTHDMTTFYMKTDESYTGIAEWEDTCAHNAVCLNDGSLAFFDLAERVTPVSAELIVEKQKSG